MRGAWILVAWWAGCVPAGTGQHGEVVFLEGGDEAPAPAPAERAGAADPVQRVQGGVQDVPGARELYERVEARLLEAEPLEIAFEVTAEGELSVDASGVARFGGEGEMTFEARGTFAGQPFDGRLQADGETLRGGSAAGTVDQPVPPALKEAMVLGFMRGGILDDLGRLSRGEVPAHADGEVRPWMAVVDHRLGEPTEVDGVRAWPLSFDITRGGEPAAEATLWIDAGGGLPLRRRQVVLGPEGQTHVVERYTSVVAAD